MGSSLKELLNFLVCALGVFFCYLYYGIVQEKITKAKYGPQNEPFEYFFSLLFFQCIVNSVFAVIAQTYGNEQRGEIPESKFALCGFTYIGAMFSSNYSLKFVSYLTQVISKSVKPISVMLLNVALAKQKYPVQKYVFVVMISVGVMLFMYKGKASSSRDEDQSFGIGELLLIVSLCLDGWTGGVQESLRRSYNIGSYTLMLHMNLWSVLYLVCAIVFTGEGPLFLQFVHRNPEVVFNIMCFGLTSAVGQVFLFTLVTKFGSLACSIVTTTRKFFTVLASVLIFGHVLTTRQWFGACTVFAGILLDQVYGKVPHSIMEAKMSNLEVTKENVGLNKKKGLKSS